MVRRFAVLDLGLLLVYCAMLTAIVWGMSRACLVTLDKFEGTEGAELQREWSQWRNDVAEKKTDRGLVKRRVPKSLEPPTVVLLREHFAVCLTAAIVLSSVLYAFFAFVIRGMWTQESTKAVSKGIA